MARNYRPQYSTSPLERAIGAALATWTGQQQGKAARQQQDAEERQQQQQQFLSLIPQLQAQERQNFQAGMAPLQSALEIPNLDPETQQQIAQGVVGYQQQYRPTDYSGVASQIIGRNPRDRSPLPVLPRPQAFQAPALPSIKTVDPNLKTAAAAFGSSLDDWFRQAQGEGDNESALAIQDIQTRLAGKKITPDQAKAELGPIVVQLKRKGQTRETLTRTGQAAKELQDLVQQGVIVDEDLAAANAVIGALGAADEATAAQAMKDYVALRGRLRLQPSATERNTKLVNDRIIQQNEEARKATAEKEAVNTNETLLTRIDTARKQGNLPLLRGMVEQQAALARKYPGTVRPFLDGYGDDPQEVKRTRAVFKGIPNALGEEDYWEPETPEEVKARKERSLADLLEDPKAKAKQASEAQKALWGVFKSGRWASLSEDTRASIIDQLGEISAMTDSPLILPPGLKDIQLTPRELESKRRWEITNQRAHDKALMAKEAHERRLQALDRRIKIADQQIAGTYAPQKGARYSSAELAATKAAAANLRFVRDQYAEALKNPNHEGGKTPERWAQLVDEAQAELDATIKDPAAAVEKVQAQTVGRGPVQRRQATQKLVRVKVGNQIYSVTPEQARQVGAK